MSYPDVLVLLSLLKCTMKFNLGHFEHVEWNLIRYTERLSSSKFHSLYVFKYICIVLLVSFSGSGIASFMNG